MSVLQRPAYLANRTQSTLASTLSGGLGVAQPPRISLKDDRFTLLMPNGDRHPAVAPSLTIDVIVVGGNPTASRIYYDASYDAADAAAVFVTAPIELGHHGENNCKRRRQSAAVPESL